MNVQTSLNSLLKGINIYLVGMMGSGKTTVGRELANQLNYRFLDTDAVISQVAGNKSINELFAEEGEAAFRERESQVLARICAYSYLAIATGGGIILWRKNWSYLHHGIVVWLDAPIELLYTRLAEDTTRPLLQAGDALEKLRSLLAQRQALYAQADLTIKISEAETPENIAIRILEAIPTILK